MPLLERTAREHKRLVVDCHYYSRKGLIIRSRSSAVYDLQVEASASIPA